MELLPRTILVFLTACFAANAYAQIDGKLFRTDGAFLSKITVTENGNTKKLPWTGGVNHPQFAMADLDNDGKKELLVYEVPDISYGMLPLSNNVKTFVNKGTAGNPQYVYAPEFEYLIPYADRYMKMMDYNCDQVPDFLYGDAGLNICDGYYNANNIWSYKNCREVRYSFGTNSSGVPILTDDVPGIVDMHKDNDLDLVTFSTRQNGMIEYYRDMRAEDGMVCDSIKIKFKDECWGKVQQTALRAHLLGVSCANIGLKQGDNEHKTTHGSNSICLFDADGDGDFDALIGNSFFSDIQFLKNGRVEYNYPVDTMIAQDTTWQLGGHKLNMASYPMAYWLDVDADQDKDILIAPQTNAQNYKSIAYYRNMGDDNAPNFVYQSDSFLVADMVDAGSNSYPFLYDYNKDGKKDLFVGSRGYYQPGGTYKTALLYLECTSAGANLSFNLVTRNFLNISSLPEQGAALAIGDLDQDGLDDLVAGRLDGSLVCYKNHAASANVQPDWQLLQGRLKDSAGVEIYAGNYAAPCIYDIDGDGKKDLVIGNETGGLVYYKNVGSQGQFRFAYRTNKLGNVKVVPDQAQGYSAPYIGPIDNSGKEYLMVGSGTGAIYRYTGYQNGNVTGAYTMLDSIYSELKPHGEFSSVAFADLFDDNKFELFTGSGKGGIAAYRQAFDVHVDDVKAAGNKLEIYPNPAHNQLHIVQDDASSDAELIIYDRIGRRMTGLSIYRNGKTATVDITALPAGVYLCSLRDKAMTKTAVFVKQ